ncbi:GTPase [Pseudactinotalea sp. Z1748]|uniref:GTPase n=1 Tax=Pseudactinotalea sp. Z1748 TaxID=3413027 RepID=UPI003C7DEA0D
MRRVGGDLASRIGALEQATALVEGLDPATLPTPGPVQQARAVLDRVAARQGLSTAHTVVAFAGATGSGKSSLVNAVSGTQAATVGARRPTTATAVGVFSGDADGAALLDWLEVDQRRHEPELAEGLILVDLPDVDSVHIDHHRIADALIETVDVLLWVLDPQKYADAVVHTRYLRPMAQHAEVTVVVLNQIDTLTPDDLQAVLADLDRRLAKDGIAPAHVLATSATTGTGVARLRQVVTDFAGARTAAHARLAAEVTAAADELARAYPPPPSASLSTVQVREVHTAMARAAGVERVGAAVAGSFRHRSRARTGWPLTRWVRRLRPDPISRLRLPTTAPDRARQIMPQGPEDRSEEQEPVTTVTSRPDPGAVEVARVDAALARIGRTLAQDAREPWYTYLRTAAQVTAEALTDTLDAVVVRTTPRPRPARWWPVVSLLHWVLLALLAAGALWLGVLAAAGYLQIPTGPPPRLGPVPLGQHGAVLPAIPWPTALFLAGLAGGLLLAGISRIATGIGARRRGARAVRDLTRAVGSRVDEAVVAPAQRAAETGARYAEAVQAAREGPRSRRRAGSAVI